MRTAFDAIIIGAGPAGAATAIDLARRGYQVAVIDKARLAGDASILSQVQTQLRYNPFLRDLLTQSEIVDQPRTVYPVYFPPRRCYSDGVLLVGDAARVSEPVTGEGIYIAWRSGLLAAATLHGALAVGDFSQAYLRRYDVTCGREFRPRLRINALLRWASYQPKFVTQLMRSFGAHGRLLDGLVQAVCPPRPLPSRSLV